MQVAFEASLFGLALVTPHWISLVLEVARLATQFVVPSGSPLVLLGELVASGDSM